MSESKPYVIDYFFDQLYKGWPRPKPEPVAPMYELKETHMRLEGSVLNPYGNRMPDPFNSRMYYNNPKRCFKVSSSDNYPFGPEPNAVLKKVRPLLPDATGNVWTDINNEFNLVNKLNTPGNIRAQRKFNDVQRLLQHKLTASEKELLTLAEFMPNETFGYRLEPGMHTAMAILGDYWPRWFGGKAGIAAKDNTDIYWVPWNFFMEDEYINNIKNDLVANLFNDKAKESLLRRLMINSRLGNEITEFNYAEEHPLRWSQISYQMRATDYYSARLTTLNLKNHILNPKYWALGNFSIQALPQGVVIPLNGGGHRICVSDMYLFIHDTFNFEGLELLGFWDFKTKRFPSETLPQRILWNADFNNFRKKHGYGRDFTVLSPLYRIPDFEGKCWDVQ